MPLADLAPWLAGLQAQGAQIAPGGAPPPPAAPPEGQPPQPPPVPFGASPSIWQQAQQGGPTTGPQPSAPSLAALQQNVAGLLQQAQAGAAAPFTLLLNHNKQQEKERQEASRKDAVTSAIRSVVGPAGPSMGSTLAARAIASAMVPAPTPTVPPVSGSALSPGGQRGLAQIDAAAALNLPSATKAEDDLAATQIEGYVRDALRTKGINPDHHALREYYFGGGARDVRRANDLPAMHALALADPNAPTTEDMAAFVQGYVDAFEDDTRAGATKRRSLLNIVKAQAEAAIHAAGTPIYQKVAEDINAQGPWVLWASVIRPTLIASGASDEVINYRERDFQRKSSQYSEVMVAAAKAGQRPPTFQDYLAQTGYTIAE